MTTYEKTVKGATKTKLAAPKPKYIEPILMATGDDNEDFRTIMRSLQSRLQEPTWTVVYKSLIVLHIMIREGSNDTTLKYLSRKPKMLDTRGVMQSASHGSNDIRPLMAYSKYLTTRAKEYASVQFDFVRDERSAADRSNSGGRLRELSVDKGLLRQVESVQTQIDALLKCRFTEAEVNNEVILTSFRMLVHDLLSLYQCLNEGVINILEHYFEMSKYDAERSLSIYMDFVDQTKSVVAFLKVAKHLEYYTKLHVPTIKHAPTALAKSLEEYLLDENFEINRRQYLAEKEGKQYTQQNEYPKPVVRQNTANPWFSPDQQSTQFTGAQNMYQSPPIDQTQFNQMQQFQSPQMDQNLHQMLYQTPQMNEARFSNEANPNFNQTPQMNEARFSNEANPNFNQTPHNQFQQTPQANQIPTPRFDQLQTPQFGDSPQFGQFSPLNFQITGQTGQPNQQNQTPFSIQQTGQFPQQTGQFNQQNQFPHQSQFSQQTGQFPQQTGQVSQQTLPQQTASVQNLRSGHFQKMASPQKFSPSFTGAGFGGYSQTPQANPFAKSVTVSADSGTNPSKTMKRASTNPFALEKPIAEEQTPNPFSSKIIQTPTGNPFSQQQIQQQPTAGGLEHLPTVPIFPETQLEAKKQSYNFSGMPNQQIQMQHTYNPFQ